MRTVYPYVDNDKVLHISSDCSIKKGDVIKLGVGTLPNGDYRYISVERGRGSIYTNRAIAVKEVLVRGKGRTGFKYELILQGDYKDYKCDSWNALESGELIAPNYKDNASGTTTSVADEIIKLKELKDSGIITEAEFEKQKEKLLK